MNILEVAVPFIVLIIIVILAIFTEGLTLPFALPVIAVMLNRLGIKI